MRKIQMDYEVYKSDLKLHFNRGRKQMLTKFFEIQRLIDSGLKIEAVIQITEEFQNDSTGLDFAIKKFSLEVEAKKVWNE